MKSSLLNRLWYYLTGKHRLNLPKVQQLKHPVRLRKLKTIKLRMAA